MELNKQNIIKVLEENTVWFEALYEDLIHKGRFESIADEIVELTEPVVSIEFKEKYKTDFDEFIKVKCKQYDTLEFIYKENVYELGSLHRLWKKKYKVKP